MNTRKDDRQQHNGQLETVNIFDYFNVLLKWKRFIGWNQIILTLVILGITFLMSDVFKSRVSLLPPKEKGISTSGLLQLTKDLLPGNLLGKLQGNQETYNYLAILRSRNAMEQVVRRFNLFEVYDIDSTRMEKVIKELEGNVEFDIEEEGTIVIDVWDIDKYRAADMANYFAQILNEISLKLGTQEARSNREFIQRRYETLKVDLRATEDSMKVFQAKYGIFALPEQTKAAVTSVAELKTEAAMLEVELGILKNSVGPDNPTVAAKQLEVDEMNKKLKEMKYGTPEWFGKQSTALFVPFKDLPELGTQYVRLYRDLEIQNKILEFIVPMYEQAKVEEQRDVPVVLVLDRGVPADRKDKPKRLIILVTTFIFGFFMNALFIFLVEGFRARQAEQQGKAELWLDGVFRKIQRRYKVEV